MDNQELRGKIRGALARGYCYSVNKNKVLDPDLIESMTEEVERLFLAVIENLPPNPPCLGEEEIIKIIRKVAGYEHPTLPTNYINIAKALSGRVFKPQINKTQEGEPEDNQNPTCVNLNYNCTTAKIAEQIGIKLWQAMCMMRYAENKIAKPQESKSTDSLGKAADTFVKPEKKFPKQFPISSCCNASVKIEGERTLYYVCLVCNRPCDLSYTFKP